MAPPLIALHGHRSSLVLECPAGHVPLWRYWGPRLGDSFAAGPGLAEARPTPSFALDATVPFSIFPGFGMGWFAGSALLAHRQGRDFAFSPDSATVDQAPNALRITLGDSVSRIEVVVSIALDPESDVLTCSSEVTNRGDAPLEVQWLAAAGLPLPQSARAIRYTSGRHNSEFVPQIDALGRAQWRRENRRGLTSHDAFPGAVVVTEGATAHHGTAYGAQLAWSGNQVQSVEWLDDGRFQWQLGEWLAPGEILLAQGESLKSPELLATCSPQGWGGVARNFHAAIRARSSWPGSTMKPRPVLLNTWEGFYFDHDLDRLNALADAAAALGVERFVLDDGWFGARDDDRTSLGDWWADARKYPDGLRPLVDHVVAAGMEFGLWVEPEMVNPESELFRAHPDWALQIAGRPLITARNQLVLDMTRDEVREYLFDAVARLLRDLPIAYLKWDHNRALAPAANSEGRACYRNQVLGAYALFDRIRAQFPEVEIESCAGGGGRIDAGVATRTHRFWTSDCIDAVSRSVMQPGFLQFMPPERMGSHIGTAPAHSTGRSQSLDFRAAIAVQGHLGIEFNLLVLSEAENERLAEWVAFYKAVRHLLHAESWQGAVGDSILWHAAGNGDEWLLLIYRVQPMSFTHMPAACLPFVDPKAHYRVTQAGPGAAAGNMHFDGSWLAQAGLPLPPMKAETAVIFRLARQ
jgi:alpha-galactosidase